MTLGRLQQLLDALWVLALYGVHGKVGLKFKGDKGWFNICFGEAPAGGEYKIASPPTTGFSVCVCVEKTGEHFANNSWK